jgi:hypothetical protein
MDKSSPYKATREKHLDHMVKVVPLLFLGFAIQAYFLSSMNTALGSNAIIFLGFALSSMIGLFVCHDLKHQVTIFEDRLEIQFFFYKKNIPLSSIDQVFITHPEESFSNLVIFQGNKKTRIFFVDEAEKIHSLLLPQPSSLDQAA